MPIDVEDDLPNDDVISAICSCGFTGKVRLYDIGDGPEFCCPSCDRCFPSNPIVGEDGKTNAERAMYQFVEDYKRETGWPPG